MVKERFSVSMDDNLVKWLDEMVDEKIFSSRSHALEFCVKKIADIPIEHVMHLKFGKDGSEPWFMTKNDVRMVNIFMKIRNIATMEEAVSIILEEWFENELKNKTQLNESLQE